MEPHLIDGYFGARMGVTKLEPAEPKSVDYETAASIHPESTNDSHLGEMPALEPIDIAPLEKSLATLDRLIQEHFPEQYEKERANFDQRVSDLKERITPFI